MDQSGYGAIPKYQVLGDERRIAEYVRRYDSEIAFFDDQLNRLMTFLTDRGLLDSTLVVFTADHGEAFGEDGFYFGHSQSVGLDQVRVPLVFVGPGVPQGVVVKAPVSNVAVMASILDLAGIDAPEGLVGPSLAGLFGDPGKDVAPVFFETPNQSGVVHGNAFLRHDRHAADDEAFWAAGNPNTGGYWRPLGRELVSPLDPRVTTGQPPPERQLGEWLATFDRDAQRARTGLESVKVRTTLRGRIVEQLRALGYTQ
jgi:arylsulfatase A-like enzyme